MKKLLGSICLATIFLMVFAIVPVSGETLRILTWEGYAYEKHNQKFIRLVKEKHGTDLQMAFEYVTTDDDFFPALRDGKADIAVSSHHIAKDSRYRMIDLNLVLPLNLENIPNYKNIIPSLQRAEYSTKGSNIYAVPSAVGTYGLAYNTSVIPKEPKTWNIFWEPKYRGRYAIGNQYESNVYVTALSLGIPPDKMSDFYEVNIPEVQKKLAGLAVNAHTIWQDVDTAEELKGLALAAVWGNSISGLRNMGEMWKIAEPKEGTTTYVCTLMIGSSLENKPKLKQIAEEWFNYVLTDEIQVYDVRDLFAAPVTTTVRASLTPEEVEDFHLDDPAHFEKKRILWPVLKKRNRQGLRELWENALRQRK
ncbi:extracellular solute-binding protein [Desulfobacterales bacterium HSG2]|nr:extracellular solute-binding protein [Desulfobacterales bacterium HSG2]